MTREEEILEDLYYAKEFILDEGYKEWSYTILAIDKAIEYLTEIQSKKQ